MNITLLAELSLAGFLVSLVLGDVLRAVIGPAWPRQEDAPGLRLELRPLAWIIALLAGPGLFWDQTRAFRHGECGRMADRVAVIAIMALWSLAYGITLHGLVTGSI